MRKQATFLANFCMRLLETGQDSLVDRSCRLQLLVFNFSLFLAIGLSLIVVMILLITAQISLLLKLPLPALLGFLGIFYLARQRQRQRFLMARVGYILFCLMTLTSGVFLYGKQSGLSMFCINLALFPFLLFRSCERGWIAFCSIAAFALFQALEFNLIPSGTHPFSTATEPYFRFIFSLGTFIGVAMPSVLLLWQSNEQYKKALKRNRVLAMDEKLTAIGRLAAGAAHEINNPLAIIRLTLENLDGLTDDKERRGFKLRIQKGYDAVQRIHNILQKLLVSTIMAESEPKPMAVQAIADLIVQRSSRYLKNRGIGLSVSMELREKSQVVCQQQHVIEAVDSLINNALEAMLGLHDPAVALTLKCQNHFFLIQVEDRGPGVSQEMIRSIFTPFFTTKEVGSGLGLSLYSARCIARQHGGDLTCEKGPGGRFYLSLPLQMTS